jgi:hypothetical protein
MICEVMQQPFTKEVLKERRSGILVYYFEVISKPVFRPDHMCCCVTHCFLLHIFGLGRI